MSEGDATELFSGFVWAVPTAFAAAVSSFRFEQGDVLYSEPRGYAALFDGTVRGLTAIQVRQPPRSARSLPSEFEGDRRLANWHGEVELDRVDLATGTLSAHKTTQGRLFSTLWRGGDEAFRPSSAEPPLPRSARELGQVLREGSLVLPASGTPLGTGHRFAFVVDLASDASRTKAAAIADALASLGESTVRDDSPAALAIEDAGAYLPTLVVRSIVVHAGATGASRGVAPGGQIVSGSEAIEAALKRVLYAGSGETERFSLARHGRLESL